MERKSPVQGEIYRHFKNKLYQIVGVAIHSESREKLVIYQALYDNFATYARPYDMFMSEVDREKYPDVKQMYRFEKVGVAGQELDICEETAKQESMADIQPEVVEVKDNTDNADNVAVSEDAPNPDLLAFLDADTFEEKHKLLRAMAPRITDRLINDIAASIDVTVEEGDLQTRYKSLLYCVSKFDEYEVNRLR